MTERSRPYKATAWSKTQPPWNMFKHKCDDPGYELFTYDDRNGIRIIRCAECGEQKVQDPGGKPWRDYP